VIPIVLCAMLAAAPEVPAPDQAGATLRPIRRFALVVGANDGGPGRVRLRYARADAERVARVLERLGGVAAEDEALLLDPDADALRQAFRAAAARLGEASATHRAELVLYYSGHSDEQGLLLRGARVEYGEVRRFLEGVGAEVRIAIVDSCSSGALTRSKGGQRAPPFLVDTSSAVKGHAILTSSAADEASQESDRVGASFFTHFLLTGLRGAADASLDGKVTVGEAYQFAFGETLARTEKTRSGAQHPTYDIQLVGSGDVVLTDLRGTGATLVFPETAWGRFSVRDRDERLVAEMRKPAGRPVELGVEPGTYRVVRDDGERLSEAQVAVASGAHARVPVERLAPVPRELTALRGGELVFVPVDFSIFPPISMNGDRPTLNHAQIGLVGSRTTRLRGVGVAPVLWADEDVKGLQLAGVGASARGQVRGAQISAVANVAGDLRGVQLSPVLNLVRGEAFGLQQSWLANFTNGRVRGAQISQILNFTGSLEGAQIGAVNVARQARGAQLGVTIFSLDSTANGGQVEVVDVSRRVNGIPLGLLNVVAVNVAGSLEGAQVGTVNVAREVRGVQVGVVNVSRGSPVRGWQVGLVNVSHQVDGVPLGLVNVVRDGWRRVLALSDADGSATLGYAGGVARFHTALEASLQRTAGGARGWASFGPGLHLRWRRAGLDLDLLGQHAVDEVEPYLVLTLRALAAFSLSPRVAIAAGPTASALLARDPASAPRIGAVGWAAAPGENARAWAGFQVGLRL